MRKKRSKDTQLVDKFTKQKDSRAAESQLRQPINPTIADDDFTHSTGREEDEDLTARDSHFSVALGFETRGSTVCFFPVCFWCNVWITENNPDAKTCVCRSSVVHPGGKNLIKHRSRK